MQTLKYNRVQETLYKETLDNGLTVYLLPKPGFKKTYAAFATNYGSTDRHFKVEGKEAQEVPDGIAHFLEHKMFEEPNGDIFATFASQGASANAFTSFDRTVYLFSATEQIHENLDTLIHFVQNPYFTDENVEKEKGIIGQEINMYKDHPDWQAYFGLIRAMYSKHPIHIDIAGTVESISHITKELLYDCYNTFYHPSNMALFVVGGIDVNETMLLIKDSQAKKTFPKQGHIERIFEPEPDDIHMRESVFHLPVSMPKCLIGFKDLGTALGGQGQDLLDRECSSKLMLDLLIGASSSLYQNLYDADLISDSFSHEYNVSSDYGFSVIGGDTKDPDAMIEQILQGIEQTKKNGITSDDFERARRKKIGSFLRMLNSPEALANEFTRYQFRGLDLFDVLRTYENMTLEQVQSRIEEHLKQDQMAYSVVRKEEVNG